MHIQLSTWLVAPAVLLLPTVTAFYPYQYDDDSTPTSRTRRTPQLSSSDSDSNSKLITLPIRRIPTPIRPRQNAYSIVNSKDPTQKNSVAIDQDGQDLTYMVAVTFGDSKEEYHLLLDSAASSTWVMGQDCKTDACGTHTLFGAGDSSTLKTQSDTFSVTYGSGTVSGTLAQDTLHISTLSPSLTFGLATNVSQEFSLYPMDGILGIGRGTSSESTKTSPQIMDVLSTSRLIGSKLYGIHLPRSPTSDGELNLGAANPARFDGDLNWNTCLDTPSTGFWEIPITDAHVSGQALGLTNRTAIIDTGTSFLLLPPADALTLHSQIPGFTQSGETFSVPCDTTADLQMEFNQHVYNISAADWRGNTSTNGLCRSNIIGRKTFNDTQWLVGDVFLKNVYSVFDFEAGRVGFGVKGGDAVKESTQQQQQSSASKSAQGMAATATSTSTSTSTPTTTTASSTGVAQSQGQTKESGSVSVSVSDSVSGMLIMIVSLSISISIPLSILL